MPQFDNYGYDTAFEWDRHYFIPYVKWDILNARLLLDSSSISASITNGFRFFSPYY